MMIYRLRLFKVLVVVFTVLSAADCKSITRRVLFLGNSYTYVNNLPQIIAGLASTTGDTLIFDSHTPGGYTLLQHSLDSTGLNKIISGGWDYVVLQEQSQLPSFPDYLAEGVYSICSLIRDYNPCARIMFYMTWGRKNGDQSNCAVWPPVCTYNGMDSLIRMRYLELALLQSSEVSPVGAVWRYIRNNHPSIELYDPDESHPSTAGSYTAACAFYSVIFKKDPSITTYDFSLTPGDAATIRNAAKLVAFDSLATWDKCQTTPYPDFTFSIGSGQNEILTINGSDNVELYYWEFGDGDTSTHFMPTHSYAANGTYIISLIGSNCDLGIYYSDTIQRSVTFCEHTPLIQPDNLVICPGAQDTLWTQVYDSYQWYESYQPVSGATGQYHIPTPWKTYFVEADSAGCKELSASVTVNGFTTGLVVYYINPPDTTLGPDTLCIGDTLQWILNTNKPPDPLNTVEWFLNNQVIASGIDTLLITQPGAYKVTVTGPYCPQHPIYTEENEYVFINCNINIGEQELSQYSLYPQPASNLLFIRHEANFNLMSYQISDITGRICLKGNLTPDNKIDISVLRNGVYLFTANDQTFRTRFIIRR